MKNYFSFPHLVTRRIFAKQVLYSFFRVLCGLDLLASQPFLGDHLSPVLHRPPELGLCTDGPGVPTPVYNILTLPDAHYQQPPTPMLITTSPNPQAHHHQPPTPMLTTSSPPTPMLTTTSPQIRSTTLCSGYDLFLTLLWHC